MPAAREALGLPSGPLVLISGGGWGVGDLQKAADAALAVGATPVCLCGTNDALRARLDRAGLRTEGFTTRMCEWLAAADVLVHSTAGLTVREAELCGTWAISYGWGVGHIRFNNAAYRRFGLAAVADTPQALETELTRALATPRIAPARRRLAPVRRRRGARAVRLILAASAAWTVPALAPVAPPVAAALRLPRRVPDGIALTFDDGPHPQGTPAILDALGDVKATFFMVGERVLARTRRRRARSSRAGHAVGIHGHRHRNLLRLTPAAIARDLDAAREAIGDAHRRRPRRCTARRTGSTRGRRCGEVRRRGWTPLLWSRWGHDWRAHTPRRSGSPPRSRAISPPATSCCCTTATTTARRDSWRRRTRRRAAASDRACDRRLRAVVQRHAPVVLRRPSRELGRSTARPMMRWHGAS